LLSVILVPQGSARKASRACHGSQKGSALKPTSAQSANARTQARPQRLAFIRLSSIIFLAVLDTPHEVPVL